MQCKEYTNNKKRCKLYTTNNNTACHIHSKVESKFPKPKECPICFNSIHQCSKPLICGHWVHKSCIQKSMKFECPICRTSLATKSTIQDTTIIPENAAILAVIAYKLYSNIIRPNNILLGLDYFTTCILSEFISIEHPTYSLTSALFYADALEIYLTRT